MLGSTQKLLNLKHLTTSLLGLLLTACASATNVQAFVAEHTTCTPATFYRPRWSPDSSQIAYLFSPDNTSSGGSTDIFVMDADGEHVRRVLSDPDNYMWSLAWWPSAEGMRLAFDYQSTALSYIPQAGGDSVIFVEGNTRFVANPNWSRDGKRFSFASNRTGNWDVFYTDAPAPDIDMQRWFETGLARYADGLGDEQAPVFSPDNAHIAFVSSRDSGFDLYTRPASGGPALQLTDTLADEYHPSWSPDGQWIVYSVGYGTSARIATIAADGSGQRAALGDGYAPDWSAEPGPDGNGSRIAFVSERTGQAEIYTMLPDGSDVRQVTNNPTGTICIH